PPRQRHLRHCCGISCDLDFSGLEIFAMAVQTEPNKIIYSMIGVGKKIDKKVILKDIYLSYFYGAKIGVLGYNGAGKSTLLRILAGVDKDFEGSISLQPGYTVGFLEQEPKLDPEKTVREIVQEG